MGLYDVAFPDSSEEAFTALFACRRIPFAQFPSA